MTDTTPESVTLTEVLMRHAMYQRFGTTQIAIDDDTLQDLTGTDTVTVTPRDVTLLEPTGSPEWVDRMIRIRATLVRALDNSQKALRDKEQHLERLGEAILEQANERDWCEEYDTFAEEWGLPKRTTEWEVTMTVKVEARNEDDAITLVKDGVSIDTYDGPVVDGPNFYASTVY